MYIIDTKTLFSFSQNILLQNEEYFLILHSTSWTYYTLDSVHKRKTTYLSSYIGIIKCNGLLKNINLCYVIIHILTYYSNRLCVKAILSV